MTLDNMTGITKGSYTGNDMFCKSQLITCQFVKACNGVCPFEDALQHADKMQTNEAVQGVGRYENAMRKLQDMPRYLNGVKEKQITKISADAVQGWIPLSHDGLGTDFPYERDGEWVIVTDGNNTSVERIKKDAYDHFFPNGRWFELEDAIAWMPLPTLYKGGETK